MEPLSLINFLDQSTPSIGRDGEKKMELKMENNGENSGPLTLLPVDRLMATDCNAAARANKLKLALLITFIALRAHCFIVFAYLLKIFPSTDS